MMITSVNVLLFFYNLHSLTTKLYLQTLPIVLGCIYRLGLRTTCSKPQAVFIEGFEVDNPNLK
mgnify:CR=1 FL=1